MRSDGVYFPIGVAFLLRPRNRAFAAWLAARARAVCHEAGAILYERRHLEELLRKAVAAGFEVRAGSPIAGESGPPAKDPCGTPAAGAG